MGLDMYLKKHIYIGANYEHNNVKGKISLTTGKEDKPVDIKLNRVSEIVESVGYWRKANQIHKWFVDNVQDGKDDCGDYDVSEEKIEELLSICKRIKADHSLAETLLPSQPGFFFGNTAYDEWYFQQIDETIEIIEVLIKERGKEKYFNGDLKYHSSW